MRITAPLMTVVGSVAGIAAAAVAYQSATGAAAATPKAPTTQPAPAVSTSWLPCEKGWKLEGQVCVRVKEKTVVVHDLPGPSAPQAPAPVGASSHESGTSGRGQAEDSTPSAAPTPAEVHETEPSSEVDQPDTVEPTAGSVGGGD